MEDPKNVAVVGARQQSKVDRQLVMYATGAALARFSDTELGEAYAGYGEADVKLAKHIQANTVEPAQDEGIPKCLSIDRNSPNFAVGGEFIGVRIDDKDVTGRCVEYNVIMGWARIAEAPAGTKLTREQVLSAPKVYGKITTYWYRNPPRQVRRQLARLR